MLSTLLRSKFCSHVGPSVRSTPEEVVNLTVSGSGSSSSRRDADDFTGKVWPALGHDMAVAAMTSAVQGRKKEAS
uniref:Uncharacterized protein n=1 Tax=Oryza glumipatula TaxID=40148 RepID=A0A0E0AS88_9ORYZ